ILAGIVDVKSDTSAILSILKGGSIPSSQTNTAVGRDLIDNILISGDHNKIFIGEYERLRDAYVRPWQVFERVDLENFIGREWLLEKIDTFIGENDRGYFILEAEAGLGKTAFLAWLTRTRAYIHHFVELTPGRDGVATALKSLAAQIVLSCHLSAYDTEDILPTAAVRPDYLLNLLREGEEKLEGDEKIFLIVDALDEGGTPPNKNFLGLPPVLPERVYIIVSQRPVHLTLQIETATTPRRIFHMKANSYENR